MFEMTFPDGKTRGMAFDSLSHARHGVYVTPHGSAIVRKDWDKMKRKLVYDVASPMSTGPKRPHNPLASSARGELDSAISAICEALALPHEEIAGQIGDIIDEAERVQIQEYARSLGAGGGKGGSPGKGALDWRRQRARDGDDDDDDADGLGEFRKYLRGRGLNNEAVEAAVAIAKRDREVPTVDRLPVPGPEGRGGYRSGRSKHDDDVDLTSEYGPGFAATVRDNVGERDPNRGEPGYDPAVYRAGLAAAAELPGGGVSRRLSNDTALSATDADLAKDYPGIENVIVDTLGQLDRYR
jgi:hypothetical protein